MGNSHIEDNKRIAKNTIMLYIRMLFGMLVSLYTTRVVLQTLGVEDFGINNLVGGVVAMMGIVTSLLSQGTSRFITIALGKNNIENLKNTFSASLTIHITLALLILLIGELVGPSFIRTLNINPERLGAAQFVFQLSLIGSVIGIIQTPYHAAITAHERMSVYAYFSIFDVVAKLLIVYLLLVVDVDKLKLYSLFYFVVGLITMSLYLRYCMKNFIECRSVKFAFDWKLYREIFNYTGWNAIGACAFTMNGQGITILLSTFGTVVNAARGIAGSISGFAYSFVSNFQVAADPQITKLYAVGEAAAMNNLIIRVSKFSSFLMGLLGVPLFLEMEFVLQLWLKDVPDYTVVFARLTLIQALVQAIDFPVGKGIHAVGKMKLPNITSAFIYMMILPISYVAIQLGASPEIAYIMIVCVYPLALLMDLYILNRYTNFPVWNFIRNVVVMSLIFIVVTYIIVKLLVVSNMDSSFMRMIVTGITTTIIIAIQVYLWGFTIGEKQYIVSILKNKLHLNNA